MKIKVYWNRPQTVKELKDGITEETVFLLKPLEKLKRSLSYLYYICLWKLKQNWNIFILILIFFKTENWKSTYTGCPIQRQRFSPRNSESVHLQNAKV